VVIRNLRLPIWYFAALNNGHTGVGEIRSSPRRDPLDTKGGGRQFCSKSTVKAVSIVSQRGKY
jgi:hypothetical protein